MTICVNLKNQVPLKTFEKGKAVESLSKLVLVLLIICQSDFKVTILKSFEDISDNIINAKISFIKIRSIQYHK